ncbi:Holliday junction branch migration protein RuvA [Arcanobacterium bovis]|uniref:Holliday junction branch migration complex subunit RuvA n=1 Tax=Arcanobacterium bovis TaxID=2529275 RepID=A0A4Q9V1A1_9ACTO|nr:Holliday junction branch migration protein RuvA [Arcanobacterium bovis]TBW22880.1 Holliday junction branch migration protein RuvA [Arcanobacterium bovis]
MIASLRGTVLSMTISTVVIDVGGVGMLVYATPSTLSSLRIGAEATLFTSLVVKEDSLTLFGFMDDDERAVFEVLNGVSGIGPRTALVVLSVHSPDDLRRAVQNKDEAALTRVSGIGKKGAQRMILEIGDKLGPSRTVMSEPAQSNASPDVLEALVNLGWQEKDASSAIEEAKAVSPDATVAQLLRSALQILGSRR